MSNGRSTGVGEMPRVWLLTARSAGDNSQVLALGEALGWPFEVKRFVYRRFEPIASALGPTLVGINPSASSLLQPPWPDLVISSGRKNEPICRWIQEQAALDGHAVRLVHIGRPLARIERFDVVITTPQYRLAEHPKVLQNEAPLQRVVATRLAEAAEFWAPRLASLRRPYTAVMVGGNSGPYTLDRRAARRLGREASALADASAGSLLVTTSARTSRAATEALELAITAPHFLYKWSRDRGENPYFAFLGLADSIIASGDSVSMLTEACATAKPVYIFDIGHGTNSMRPASPGSGAHPPPDVRWLRNGDWDYPRSFVYRLAMRLGLRRLTRDIRLVHQILIASGRAVWLGEEFPLATERPPLQDVARAAARVRALFASVPAVRGDAGQRKMLETTELLSSVPEAVCETSGGSLRLGDGRGSAESTESL
jgi:mitochondrial fission protein ELM1